MTHPAEAERGVVPAGADLPDVRDGDPRRRRAATPDEHLVRHQRAVGRLQRGRRRQPGRVDPRRQVGRGDPHDVGPATASSALPVPQVHELQQRRRHGRGRSSSARSRRPERLGVAEDRWVFPHSGTDCHEHPFVSNRDTFARTPAIELGGKRALELAGVDIDDIAVVDLYSCFPSAVQLGAQSLGLSTDRQLTRTGGLPFAGGPWNNYVMHAIATVVGDLREQPGEHGPGVGQRRLRHQARVRRVRHRAAGRGRSATPTRRTRSTPCPAASWPPAEDAAGTATIEAYTVMHGREGLPEQAIATCLLADGRRAWGLSTDGDVMGALLRRRVGRHRRRPSTRAASSTSDRTLRVRAASPG